MSACWKPPERSSSTAYAAIVGAACAILCLPFLRSIHWLGDEGVFLRAAILLNDGKTLYNDFFEFHPPIAFVVMQLWLKLTGPSLAGARMLVVLVVAGISFLTCLICLRVSKSRPLSAALPFIWALSSQGFWTQINHHWLATFFSLIAFLNLLRQETDQNADNKEDQFDLDFALMTGELSQMLADLTRLLGGDKPAAA